MRTLLPRGSRRAQEPEGGDKAAPAARLTGGSRLGRLACHLKAKRKLVPESGAGSDRNRRVGRQADWHSYSRQLVAWRSAPLIPDEARFLNNRDPHQPRPTRTRGDLARRLSGAPQARAWNSSGGYRPPRATRSISARTSRSTMMGRFSSSQLFSIGRSMSFTRSSSVRALWLRTVWVSILNA